MSTDPSLVDRRKMYQLVRHVVADVLMVRVEQVNPDSKLVEDLGAESIDFLDLVFRLEETLGLKIPHKRWSDFVSERLGDQDPRTAITTTFVHQFAEQEMRR